MKIDIDDKQKYHVPNLERAFSILELLVQHSEGLTMTQIVDSLNYPINSVFRITTTLLNRGYLQREEGTKKFRLSRKFLSLGYASLSEHNILEKALDIMKELRDITKEIVLLATISENGAVVLDQVPGLHPFKFSVDIGSVLCFNAAAPAKAILAYLPDKELKDILSRAVFKKYNEQTITSKSAYLKELESIRSNGYALDRAEELEGVHCIGAPVFNHQNYPVAAIWSTGPCERMPVEDFQKIGKIVRKHADRISGRLGWTNP